MSADRLQEILTAVQAIIADPTSNLTAAVFLLSIVGILALLLMIAIALTVYFIPMAQLAAKEKAEHEASASRVRHDEPAVPQKGGAGRRAQVAARPETKLYTVLIWVVALGAVVAAYAGTGSTSFCAATCHRESEPVISWEEGTHASIACASCHERSAAGVLTNIATRVDCALQSVTGGITGSRPVSDQRCLACHRGLASVVLTDEARGLVMDHRHPVEDGVPCAECHGGVGHVGEHQPRMTVCVRCHDGERARSECETCHLGDPTEAATQDRDYPKVVAANRDCGGCHDQTSCDACHGIRMPHTEEFIKYGHARDAVFEGKEACWKCHDEDECGRCHGRFDGQHGVDAADSRRDHIEQMTPALRKQDGVVCACHDNSGFNNFCALCHDDAAPLFKDEPATGQ